MRRTVPRRQPQLNVMTDVNTSVCSAPRHGSGWNGVYDLRSKNAGGSKTPSAQTVTATMTVAIVPRHAIQSVEVVEGAEHCA